MNARGKDRPDIELSKNARDGIFMALAEKLNTDNWIPSPQWWLGSRGDNDSWIRLSAEEKLAAWIVATDHDYIRLAEDVLGHRLKERNEQQQDDTRPPDGRRSTASTYEKYLNELDDWRRNRNDDR